MTRVFVYGSLKRHFKNAGFLDTARFVREAQTANDNFSMVEFREADPVQNGIVYSFPGVVKLSAAFNTEASNQNNPPGRIAGEMYDNVDDDLLAKLDELEEIDKGLYKREMVRLDDGSEAWMYMLANENGRLNAKEPQHVAFDAACGTYTWMLSPDT